MYISIAEQTKIVIPFALKARFKRHSWFLLHHPRRSRAPLYMWRRVGAGCGNRGVYWISFLRATTLPVHHIPVPPVPRPLRMCIIVANNIVSSKRVSFFLVPASPKPPTIHPLPRRRSFFSTAPPPLTLQLHLPHHHHSSRKRSRLNVPPTIFTDRPYLFTTGID